MRGTHPEWGCSGKRLQSESDLIFSYSQVYKSDKHEIGFKNNKAVLVIHKSDIDDSGKYRCEAANKIGRVETEAKLTVCSKWTCFWLI